MQASAALPEAVKLERYEAEQARKERVQEKSIRNQKVLAIVLLIVCAIFAAIVVTSALSR